MLFETPEFLSLATTLAICLAAFSCLWVVSLFKNDASIVDWYWGLGFGVIALSHAFMHGTSVQGWMLTAFASVWALRLTGYMVRRHIRKGREDARYAAMRAAGGETFKRDSLVKIFWLQAVIMWVIATPLHAGLLYQDGEARSVLFVVGSALFIVGFAIETVADAQLDRFNRDPANHDRLMTDGLFAWSRHPNYFGEAVLWWGIALAGFALSGLWWSFIGPAILTFLLIKVSGVPMLEDLLAKRPGWAEYAARTPAFFPRPPRQPRTATAE
jgi:steroid 5-alpha reductase family enzyme